MKDKKRNKKAFSNLGYDPGRRKLINSFGLEDEKQLESAILESQRESAEFDRMLEDERVGKTLTCEKKRLLKPIHVLGCDPSLLKLQRHLGVSEEELRRAVEDSEEINRRAVRPLGVAPSSPLLSRHRTCRSSNSPLVTKKLTRHNTTDGSSILLHRRNSDISALERQQFRNHPKLQHFFGLTATDLKLSSVFGVQPDAIQTTLPSSSSSSSSSSSFPSSLLVPLEESGDESGASLHHASDIEIEGESTDDTFEFPSSGTTPPDVF